MDRREVLGILGAGAAGLTALAGGRVSADEPHAKHAADFSQCAKACADCFLECDSCYQHCAGLVVEGQKDHAETMRLCIDCGERCPGGSSEASTTLLRRWGFTRSSMFRAARRTMSMSGGLWRSFPIGV